MQEAGRLIETVWNKTVWPIIQSTFKAVFGIELPKWHKLKLEMKAWWDNEVWPKIQDIFMMVFGIELPDFKTTISNISTWWTESVWPSIKALFGAVFSIFTEDEDGQTVGQRLIEWWGKVLNALGNVISAVFGINVPTVEETVWKIRKWWAKVLGKTNLSVTFQSDSGSSHGGGSGTKWNADGAVFRKPTIFNTRLGLQGVGEAGPEAVAPIGVLQGYVQKAVRSETGIMAEEMRNMVQTFTETVENLRSQPVAINVDSKAVAVLMAREMTKSIGNRNIQSLMAMGG
jgi:hypothetical protein